MGEVRKRDVIALLDQVRERGSPIMANRVLAAVRKFFNWCIGRGILEVSPCTGITAPTREQARHRVLADEELASVLEAAQQIGFPFGSIVQVLALTAREQVAILLKLASQLIRVSAKRMRGLCQITSSHS